MRPRRLPFQPDTTRPQQKPVLPAILPLVLLLVVAVAMMVALKKEAERLRNAERGGAVRSEPRTRAQQGTAKQTGREVVIDLSLLERYEDHARQITPEPFVYLLQLCRELEVEELVPGAVRSFRYRDLFERTAMYRGRVLQFRGRVRRIVQVGPAPGIAEPYYEAWVFTADGGHLPYCVISARPPKALPVMPRLNEYCEVIGIFLGWWKHETADRRLLSSPIVVTPQLLPARSPVSETAELNRLELVVGALIAVLVVAGVAVVWWLSRRGAGAYGVIGGEEELTFVEAEGEDSEGASRQDR